MRQITEKGLTDRRKAGSRKPRSRIILAFEGYSTEFDYFKGLMNRPDIANVSDMVEIMLLQRIEAYSGHSSPEGIIKLVSDHVESMKQGKYSLSLLIENYIDSICVNWKKNPSDRIVTEFRKVATEQLTSCVDEKGFVENLSDAIKICDELLYSVYKLPTMVNIPELTKYREDTDRVCIMVDRDKEAHTEEEIKQFIRRCSELGYEPYISNPCFEFWLILHFKGADSLDREKLSENPMIENRRYTEVELEDCIRDFDPDFIYNKNRLETSRFLHRIDEAISNSESFETNIRWLHKNVGTNIGLLMKDVVD